MAIRQSTFTRAFDGAGYIAEGYDAQAIRDLNAELIDIAGLRRGNIVTFETVEQTLETEMVSEYRYGFDGQKVERVAHREIVVTSTETLKLWKTSKRGWYWKEAA